MGLFDMFNKKEINNFNIKKADAYVAKENFYADKEVLKYSEDDYFIKDDYKDKEHYLKQLESINTLINRKKAEFNNFEGTRLGRYYSSLSALTFEKIRVLYIINAEFDVIRQYVYEYFKFMKEKVKFLNLSYDNAINLLSLGYLFQIELSEYDFIKQKMIDEKYVDAILDLLRNKIFFDKASTEKDFYFKEKGYLGLDVDKDTSGLMNAINSKTVQERNNEFINFVDKIKTKQHNRLLKENERINKDDYVGSFDFKLTAIAKILKIDKELLKNSKFIAVDLI